MGRSKNIIKVLSYDEMKRERCDELNIFDNYQSVCQAVTDLKNTLIQYKDAEALAAPQIGNNYRMFCLKFANNDIRCFINPMITKVKGSTLSRESNYSIKDTEYIVPRAEEIQAAYQTPVGKAEENIFKGKAALLFQQMVDLLDGVMISDYGLEILPGFDEASDEEKKQIIDMYIESISTDLDAVNKDIDESPILSKVKENMEFLTSVAKGETDLLSYEKDADIIEELKR